MRKRLGLLGLGLLAVGAITAPGPRAHGEEIPYSALKFYIEYNATDGDVGVQLMLDGEEWTSLKAYKPDGKLMLTMAPRNSLKVQGLTELFWESSEPSLDEVPLEEFLARFPEGTYDFDGVTTEGDTLDGEAVFTHVIPAAPEIVCPPQGDTLPVVDPDDFTIDWERVTTTIDGSTDIEIVEYEVIVEQVDPKRVFSIHLPASVTSVKVPAEFFEQENAVHAFEILAIEAGHNQTIASGEFLTEP